MEASSVSTSGKEAPNLAGPIYQAILWIGTAETVIL
jgi:hypothetical protein